MSRAEDPGGRGAYLLEITDERERPSEIGAHLASVAQGALSLLHVPAGAELSLLLVEPERIADLKEKALGERGETDVLAFPIDDPSSPSPGPLVLGDVVLCPAVAEAQARALGRRVDHELEHLLVHGILHLLGWEHADPLSERAMAREERQILSALGMRA